MEGSFDEKTAAAVAALLSDDDGLGSNGKPGARRDVQLKRTLRAADPRKARDGGLEL